MKIEQLLVQHLFSSRELSLQGIGTFRLSEGLVLPGDNDKDFVLPADAISFTYDSRAKEDEALVDFIVQQTRKMKPLAAADLDSFVILSKQFLNIGKPLRIEGIGTLQKNQSGQYDFTPGQYIGHKVEPAAKPLREKTEEDITFNSQPAASTGTRSTGKIIAVLAGILLLGAAGFGAWWFFIRNKEQHSTAKELAAATKDEAVTPDTAQLSRNTPDTARKDSSAAVANTTAPADGNFFKVVFMVTNDKYKAIARMSTLTARGHKVIMYTADSVTYKLAEPFTQPLADTLRVKDSLAKWYYGKKVFVEIN